MLKTLLNQVKQFKTASILTPIFTSLEVVMGVLIPYVTSWIIDRGIMAGDVRKVVFYGVIMLILAFVSLAFGILSGRFSALASTGFASHDDRCVEFAKCFSTDSSHFGSCTTQLDIQCLHVCLYQHENESYLRGGTCDS